MSNTCCCFPKAGAVEKIKTNIRNSTFNTSITCRPGHKLHSNLGPPEEIGMRPPCQKNQMTKFDIKSGITSKLRAPAQPNLKLYIIKMKTMKTNFMIICRLHLIFHIISGITRRLCINVVLLISQ